VACAAVTFLSRTLKSSQNALNSAELSLKSNFVVCKCPNHYKSSTLSVQRPVQYKLYITLTKISSSIGIVLKKIAALILVSLANVVNLTSIATSIIFLGKLRSQTQFARIGKTVLYRLGIFLAINSYSNCLCHKKVIIHAVILARLL